MSIGDQLDREWSSSGEVAAPDPDSSGTPGAALEVPFGAVVEQLLAQHTISLTTWVTALVTGNEYETGDPEESVIGILAQILTARSSDEALASLELDRAKAMCGGEPGGTSPLLEIRAARPMKSRFDEGAPVYCIVDAVYVHNGEQVRFTTGAKAVQGAIIAHIGNGWMPFQARLEIRRLPTAAGYYPLNLIAG